MKRKRGKKGEFLNPERKKKSVKATNHGDVTSADNQLEDTLNDTKILIKSDPWFQFAYTPQSSETSQKSSSLHISNSNNKNNDNVEPVEPLGKKEEEIDKEKGVEPAAVSKDEVYLNRDVLAPDLDVVFCGINPGRWSAKRGHHYAGPGNHFWPLLYESKLVPTPLSYEQDSKALDYGIGLTNIVHRMTPSSSDLSNAEFNAGVSALVHKIQKYSPKVIVFNGKCIFDALIGKPRLKKGQFSFGLQPRNLSTRFLSLSAARKIQVVVIPSTSARVVNYQKEAKLKFFLLIKSLLKK